MYSFRRYWYMEFSSSVSGHVSTWSTHRKFARMPPCRKGKIHCPKPTSHHCWFDSARLNGQWNKDKVLKQCHLRTANTRVSFFRIYGRMTDVTGSASFPPQMVLNCICCLANTLKFQDLVCFLRIRLSQLVPFTCGGASCAASHVSGCWRSACASHALGTNLRWNLSKADVWLTDARQFIVSLCVWKFHWQLSAM